jgi:23S rRNA pseudouridine1911/1915/1917 synthase
MMTMPGGDFFRGRIPSRCAGMRLDQALSELLPDYSRSRLQQWIKAGHIEVDGRVMRPRDRVLGGEAIRGVPPREPRTVAAPEAIALDVRYRDEDILVLNKPAGLVAHPAAGNPDGTLVNALLHHAPELARLPRAGLVHRLDKDTSGLLVVACTPRAHSALAAQLQERTMGREYTALVNGAVVAGGRIDAPIGRHPVDRKRMAVVSGGKPAVTHYRVMARFRAHTCLSVRLETGRTHQIRVHMAHRRFSLLGDPVYGGRPRMPAGASARCIAAIRAFRRQALHAAKLSLTHPVRGERLEWRAEPPEDLAVLLAALREDAEGDHD